MTLTTILKNRRLSGKRLSEITGISRSSISQIVNGRLLPTEGELDLICSALNVTPKQIYPVPGMLELLVMSPEEEARAFEHLGLFLGEKSETSTARDSDSESRSLGVERQLN